MIGGGPGAFIGDVHRKAARLDGGIELVAGAFSGNARKSKQIGREQGIDAKRAYADWETMIERELRLPEETRIDFVAITVPNHLHFPMAKGFIEAGFHVMCEKPMTLDVKEALALEKVVRQHRRVLGVMHNYVGYPMVKLARDMVQQGDLGRILKVVVQYPQGWLSRPIERSGHQQASWRTDPKQSGAAGCMGDIGTHACNLAEYVSGLKVQQLCADLTTFVKGRRLDDDGNCLLRFNRGAKGILHASQVSIGEENNLAIWVYGEDASVEWHQEHPNYLYVNRIDAPQEVWKRGNSYVAEKSPAAGRATRLPFGHPEAFLEAFANHYCNFADTIRARLDRRKADPLVLDFPGVGDGVRGMRFIAAAVKSSAKGATWVKM
jgi:predicted dehydrogenase